MSSIYILFKSLATKDNIKYRVHVSVWLQVEPILINDDALEAVDSVKLLGLNISSDLTWNIHIYEIVKKAFKRLFFLEQLKRAKVTLTDLGLFYSSCIRSIVAYAVPAFHFSLPKYLMQELERYRREQCPSSAPVLAVMRLLLL